MPQTLHWCILDFFWQAPLERSTRGRSEAIVGDESADSGGGVGLRISPLLSAPVEPVDSAPTDASGDDWAEECM